MITEQHVGVAPVSAATPFQPVLILAYFYPPDNYSGAARPHRLAKYLQRLGHPVEVLSARFEDGYVHEGHVHRVRGEFDHTPEKRFPWFYVEKAARLALLPQDEGATWLPRAARLAGRWMNQPLKPVLFSTSPPVTVHMLAWWLKKRYGCRWIADFRDPLDGNPYRSLNAPRGRVFDRWLERQIFRTADMLVANTDAVAAMWNRKHPHRAEDIVTLWNGFDPERPFGPLDREGGAVRLMRHVGSIYGDRYPLALRGALSRMIGDGRVDGSRIRVELIGPLSAEREAFNAEWWKEKPPVPASEADRLIQTVDFLLLLDATHTGTSLQVPAKIFDYIRIGRPILAWTKPGSPVERILHDSGIAYQCLFPSDPEAEIDRKVSHFLSLEPTAREPADQFRATFDAVNQAAQLSEWINRLHRRK